MDGVAGKESLGESRGPGLQSVRAGRAGGDLQLQPAGVALPVHQARPGNRGSRLPGRQDLQYSKLCMLAFGSQLLDRLEATTCSWLSGPDTPTKISLVESSARQSATTTNTTSSAVTRITRQTAKLTGWR